MNDHDVNDQTSPAGTQAGSQTGITPPKVPPSAPPASAKPPKQKRGGGWFRRLLFIFLLLVVLAGLVVSALLLRMRLNAVLSDVDSLDARLSETQAELETTRSELENTRQTLRKLAEESAAARAELEANLRYRLLMQQAEAEAAKALLSLNIDDIGQARREIGALRASLVAATALASEEDMATLSDLETRASRAEADLSSNAFASQQTLEVIWRDLNELNATLLEK